MRNDLYSHAEILYFYTDRMATHSSTLAWKVPWIEEPGRLLSLGSRRVRHDERLHFHFSPSCIGEGNGNPLQCPCLENPRDSGAWWAAVCGVAWSRTGLKRPSSSRSSSSSSNENIRMGRPFGLWPVIEGSEFLALKDQRFCLFSVCLIRTYRIQSFYG